MAEEGRVTDEELVLADIRSLLDQLQLDRDGSLTMQSRLTDDLGVDSLALVELCDQFERTFEVTLPDEVFLIATTPQQWLDAINVARGVVTSSGEAAINSPPSVTRALGRQASVIPKLLADALKGRRNSRAASDSQPTNVASMLYTLYAWILLVPFALTIWTLAVLPLTLDRRRDAGGKVARLLCRALGITVRVEGTLPAGVRPSVITSNHSSFIDGIALHVFLDQPVTFVTSKDMEHQFLLGRIMRGFGCVFVDRGRAERSAASVDSLVAAIEDGHNILIFPEGSISSQPGLRVFRLGAFEAAASSECAIVPIGIKGSREILSPGSFRPHQGRVLVTIGTPIAPKGNEFADRVRLRDEVREAIAVLCGEVAS